ncbi:hypothetical protein E5083_19575 [Streptomyces bauhiniae]|uniref:Uncharacterized protein n=1 Tax=Streptomyces bauhiniae TaxID=2340725 RepID=A0A4Z1D2L4_9ACTN|nr:hypothetical protein [Streptomyces bauhiniae]TGN75835.1 hypothetical protein E5083_19575 [Streptomyces bauhiniae]
MATGARSVVAAGDIGLVVTGDGNQFQFVASPQRVATSNYRYQVESLAAAEFRGRSQELALMAEFCTVREDADSAEGAYWRWLAPAWAGKTALMAQFVMEPPAGVDVVSFFVTSRLNRQNDREAYCEVVHRQLYALLGEEEPAVTEHTREESLLAAMDRAAAVCESRGRQLVLVVDGLDEDCGVLAGPGSHSIAALLPRSPRHGMRVVVAGRPHPPLPDDVAHAHPLRRGAINRWLAPSPYAEVVRREAEDSLMRMMQAGGLARQLLGLVTAAGGGLTAADLACLADTRPRLVEKELSTVTGRAFRVRTPHWSSQDADASASGVYVLAHEEIRRSAVELLTENELAANRERLHEWADDFQARRWPPHTPEYLLRGYSQLLRAQGDTRRLVRLARDAHRHTRLWQRSGSDLDGLSELSAAFEGLVAGGGGDPAEVADAFVLAVRRDTLLSRSESLPDALIAVWAGLGRIRRAVSLARARQSEVACLRALVDVVRVLVANGELQRATEVADEAAQLADAVAGQGRREAATYAVVMLAIVGSTNRAYNMTCAQVPQQGQDEVLASAATAALHAGQRGTAEILAHAAAASLPDSVPVIAAQAMILDSDCPQAVAVIRTVGDRRLRVDLLANAASAMAEDGHTDALVVAEEALAEALAEGGERALVPAALALAYADGPRRAGEICRSLSDPYERMTSLARVAAVLATSGDAGEAADLAHESAALADNVTADNQRADGLTMAAVALALARQHKSAVELLAPLRSTAAREEAVADMVMGLAEMSDDLEWATELAHGLSSPRSRSRALACLAAAHLARGDRARAQALAQEASDATRENTGWDNFHHVAQLAMVLAEAGAPGLAVEAARKIDEPDRQAMALREAAVGAAASGKPEHGADIARAIEDPRRRAQGLGWVATAAARGGSTGLADRLIQEMRKIESRLPPAGLVPSDHRTAALAALAAAFTEDGQEDAADAITDTVKPNWSRAEVLAAIARSLAERGESDKARSLVRQLVTSPRAARLAAPIATVWARAGSTPSALAALGLLPLAADQAEALALTAKSLAGADGIVRSSGLAHHAHALADVLNSPDWTNYALSEQIALLLRHDRTDLAAAVSQHITEPGRRTEHGALCGTAAGSSTVSDTGPYGEDITAEAAFLAEQITNVHDHWRALAYAVAALTWTEQHDRAWSLLNGLPDESASRDEAAAALAEALAASGHYAVGREVARSLPKGFQRERVLDDVACWAARRGDFLIAIDLCVAEHHVEQSKFPLLKVVDLAAAKRQYAEAAVAARALRDTEDQVRALCAISAAARRHGAHNWVGEFTDEVGALLTAASESTGDWTGRQRGRLQAAAAEGWGDCPAGRAAAVEALSLASWPTCLEAVRRTAAQALPAALGPLLREKEDLSSQSGPLPAPSAPQKTNLHG